MTMPRTELAALAETHDFEAIGAAPAVLALESPGRDAVHRFFDATWELNELLFSSVPDPSNLYLAPDPLRRPLIFYFGHTAAFYVNKLRLAGIRGTGLDPRLDDLLARGVDPATAADLAPVDLWPSYDDAVAYRDRARALTRDAIDALDWNIHITPADPHWAILMGFEHDRIHFETSSVLFRQMPVETVCRPEAWPYADFSGDAPAESFISVPPGSVHLGRGNDAKQLFGWDNEFGREQREVAAFEVGRELVTQGAFRAFVDDGGYTRRELWTAEGWAWRQGAGATAPRFWRTPTGDQGWRYRAMFDEVPMPWGLPVEVNAHEAHAYCRWRGGVRLPTEAEWQRMVDITPGANDPAGEAFHLHFAAGSSRRTDACQSEGIRDVRGNVWQWLSDDFHPLPGFATHPLYDDFSEPYFDPQHAMLRGGAWATTGAGASVFYRLWFRHHFYQHAGFRVVRTDTAATTR